MGIFSFLTNGRPAELSVDDIRRAALKIVYPLPSCSDSFWGGTVEQCDRAEHQLLAARQKYEKYEPAWMREAIMDWFDYADRKIKETRKDCVTGARRRQMDEYSNKRKAERDRVTAILKSVGRG